MAGHLKKGLKLKSVNGFEYKVLDKLGEGGQGEVYQVSEGGDKYALKWYFEHTGTEKQRSIIENLIKKGEPSEDFLWPRDLILSEKTFGYIMKLRPSNYYSIMDMMRRKAEPTFRSLCIAGVNVSLGYQKLHSLGYSYRDISFGNIFLNPETGKVLICDNDNVTVNGMADIGVSGTPRFMAPEIVVGEAIPSTDTDLFSLAVLLFYMFMLHHPLEGATEAKIKCLDTPAMKKLYGTDPIFIWDPNNKTNRPVKGYQDNAIIYWDIYPGFLKDLFTVAFTEGMKHPRKRVVEKVWQDAFVKLLSSIIDCPNCGGENFSDENKQGLGVSQLCWSCQKPLPALPILEIGKNKVILNKNGQLFRHHIKEDYDLVTVAGEVVQNPQDPNKWGVRNISDEIWTFIKSDGTQTPVDKGRTVPITKGAKINFGHVIGEFK